MDDWFEGNANYIISKVLTNLVFVDNLCTLDKINKRINNFNYNDLESPNKPQSIMPQVRKKGKRKRFKMK